MPFVPARHRWTRLLAGGIAFALASLVTLAGIPVVFGSPQPMVRIYWRSIGTPDRTAVEQRFRLSEPTPVNENVWSYVPLDTSPETLRGIVTHPSVEDTDGINRRVFTIADRPPLTPRRGGLLGGVPSWMAGATRLLAYALAALSGVLLVCAGATSPLLGPGSAVRRRIRTQLTDPTSATRTLPATAYARWRHGIPAGSATIIAIATVFAATVVWRFLTFTGFTNDHYAHLALAQQMLLGDRPIHDFSDPGWPLTYLLTAAGWLVAGDAMATEWSIVAAGFAAGAACTFAVAQRLSGSSLIALLVTLFEVLIFPRSYSYPKMLVYGAGAWVLMGLAAEPSRRRVILAACAIAIAFLFRHDHGLFLGTASAVCLGLASRLDGWRTAARRVAFLSTATVVFLLPWILFVAFNGGLVDYFRAGLEYSRGEAAATRLTALPWVTFTPLDLSTANAAAWLFWLFWSLPLSCAVVAWRRASRQDERWRGELPAISALIVVSVLVNASFIREALDVRLPDAIVPVALLSAWALGACWSGRWHRRTLQRVVQFAAMSCIVLSGMAVSRIAGLPDQYDTSGIGRGVGGVLARGAEVSALLGGSHRQDTPSRYSTALAPFFTYLDRCTSPSERLIVTGEFPDILVLAGRRFAGDGVVFGAWYSSSAHQDRTLERLRAHPALFTLHMGDYATFRERFALIDRYMNEEYEPMVDVPVVDGGTIRILVSRARPASEVDAETGWPCYSSAFRDADQAPASP